MKIFIFHTGLAYDLKKSNRNSVLHRCFKVREAELLEDRKFVQFPKYLSPHLTPQLTHSQFETMVYLKYRKI